jgi:spore coat protein CotH
MSTHKNINRICVAAIILALLLTIVFCNGGLGIVNSTSTKLGYESKLFDASKVHTIDIEMDGWDSFIENCEDEEYVDCTVVVDNEAYKNVAIRAKGNTSLSSVSASGSDRYSFKVEFDQYQDSNTYYGLDKLSLNNVIQDNTYMKDYLTYQFMANFGAAAPLCSYVYITVNGEDWGLYLAVEGVEDSFLNRNYGSNYGELYKPDSLSMGGGDDEKEGGFDKSNIPEDFDPSQMQNGEMPEGFDPSQMQNGEMPEGFDPSQMQNRGKQAGDFDKSNIGGGFGGGMGSSDVKLQYIDDNPDSYSNIFDNAKTDTSFDDQTRLINSLQKLSEGEDIENVVDIEEVIRYFVVHNFVCNSDSYTGSMIHNYYLYEDDGQLSMIPWDYNLAFGSFQASSDATSSINDPIDTPLSTGTMEDRPMFAWILNNEEYTDIYHDYFSEFIEKYFTSGYMTDFINDTKEMIAPYVGKDPTKFCTYDEFEKGVITIEQYCTSRAESVSSQLSGTIASTSDGQKENSNNLIDGSSVNISTMGTMSNGMGRGGGGFPNLGSTSDTQGDEIQQPISSDSQADGTQLASSSNGSGDERKQSFSRDNQTNETRSQGLKGTTIIQLIASVAILAVGILVSKKYKR